MYVFLIYKLDEQSKFWSVSNKRRATKRDLREQLVYSFIIGFQQVTLSQEKTCCLK